MDKLEKVTKGLECCTYDLPLDNKVHKSDICKNCPYYNPETSLCLNTDYLMKDALGLLKDQKNLIDGLIEDQLKKDEEQQAEIKLLKSLVKKKNKRIKNLLKSNYLNGENLHV